MQDLLGEAFPPQLLERLRLVKLIARVATGLVWVHEGLVPKLLFQQPYELSLVARVPLSRPPPELALTLAGAGEIAIGVVLLFGWFERPAALLTTGLVLLLSVAALIIKPGSWYDPFQGVPKNLAFVACGLVVALLSPLTPPGSARSLPLK